MLSRALVTGQEAAFVQQRAGSAALTGAASLDPALLSRWVLCHYAGLVTALNTGYLSSPGLQPDAAAQALQLHLALVYAPLASMRRPEIHMLQSGLSAMCGCLFIRCRLV